MTAMDIYRMMRRRIFVEGKASNGRRIGRKANGKFTKLVITGELRAAFRVSFDKRSLSVDIGFSNKENHAKAIKLEHWYQKTIWSPTTEEQEAIISLIDAELQQQLNDGK